jgi:two-component system, sensor histidine kinase RpfC
MSGPITPDDAGAAFPADLIDFKTLKALEQLTPEASFLERLVAGYVQDAEEQLRVVTQAVEAGDVPGLRDALHAVGGSSGNVGAVRMMRWCAAMREQTDSQLLGEGPGLVQRLAMLFQESRALLERYLGDRGPTVPKP